MSLSHRFTSLVNLIRHFIVFATVSYLGNTVAKFRLNEQAENIERFQPLRGSHLPESLHKNLTWNLTNEILKFPRIIDGENAIFGEFPFQVSIQFSRTRKHCCGGALVTASHVLTACHCLGYPPLIYSVFAGSVDLRSEYLGQRRAVISVRMHPDCEAMDAGHIFDFGVMFLNNPFELEPGSVEILEIPDFRKALNMEDLVRRGLYCIAIGWGATSPRSDVDSSYTLKKVRLKLQPNDECVLILGNLFHSSSQLCTLGEGQKDACRGDSGGALLCGKNNLLTGVVSWGIGCGRKGVPGVWGRIDVAETWIRDMMTLSRIERILPNPFVIFSVATFRITTARYLLSKYFFV